MTTANVVGRVSDHGNGPLLRVSVAADGSTTHEPRPDDMRGTAPESAILANAARQRARVDSGYSRFIGRVGALAVALGIGGAIATNPGIARADDSQPSAGTDQPSSVENSESSSTSSSTAAPQSPSTPSSSPIGPPAGSVDPHDTTAKAATSEAVTALDDGVVVRSSGGAHTSDDDNKSDDDPEEPTIPESTELDDADDGAEEPSVPPDTTPPAVTPGVSDERQIPSASEKASTPETAPPATALTATTVTSDEPRTTDADGVAARLSTVDTEQIFDQAALSVARIAAEPPAAPDPIGALMAVPRALITVAFSMVDAVLTPFLGPIPTTPTPDTPLLLAVLGWVRRQFAEALQVGPYAPTAPTAVAAVAEGVHPPGEPLEDPAGLPADLERTTLVSGLDQPTDFRFLPDGSILIAEKGGAIKLYHDGHVHGEPLITLAVLPTDTDEERGLLGIEVDPDFENNGFIYVSYTTTQNYDRLSRLTVTGHTADPASEVVLLESDQLGNVFHHGGEVQFGPDGKLYWAMGMNTNNPNSQNLSNVHGKILRLNPDGSAPADNPFIDTPGAVDQIWAYGLRNPFRFTFTPDGQTARRRRRRRCLRGTQHRDEGRQLRLAVWPKASATVAGSPIRSTPTRTHRRQRRRGRSRASWSTPTTHSARSTRTRSSSRITRWVGSRNSPSIRPTPASSASGCSTIRPARPSSCCKVRMETSTS